MNPNNQNSSNVNTLLIVVILLAIVAFGTWFFLREKGSATTDKNAGFDINVQVPASNGSTQDPSNS